MKAPRSTSRIVWRLILSGILLLLAALIFFPLSSSIKLRRLLHQADRIVVTTLPSRDAPPIYESQDRNDIRALAAAITLAPRIPTSLIRCGCSGTPSIFLYRGSELLGVLSNHHGKRLRCSEWESDLSLLNRRTWLNWFDQRGIHYPLQEYEGKAYWQSREALHKKQWREAMPKGVEEVWNFPEPPDQPVDPAPLRAALHASTPDPTDQILSLLHWYGSGRGPWSSSYENVVHDLLAEYPENQLIQTMDQHPLTPSQKNGAVRYLTLEFLNSSVEERLNPPAHLKESLWEHAQKNLSPEQLRFVKILVNGQ